MKMKGGKIMNSKIVDLNSFSYERKAPKISAYGKEYELPVRTGEFCDRQDEIDRTIADTSKFRSSEDIINIVRDGIALFIGAGEAERIFPKEGQNENIDIDEITVFYRFLKDASLRNLAEYTKKYNPAAFRK